MRKNHTKGTSYTDETSYRHFPVTLYITEPKGDAKPKAAVLYLTDVFGIQLAENKLCVSIIQSPRTQHSSHP